MAEQTRKTRWMPIVLGLSLALNLAVFAALAGAAWRHTGDDRKGPRASRGGAVYMQALPREARRAVRETLRGALPARMDQGDMVAALRAEPFDATAAARILEAQRDTSVARQQAASAAWLAHVTRMSAQERDAYADRLEALLEKRKGGWKKQRSGADADR